MKALQESGLRVPQDVSVVGYGDMPFAHMVSLTSVSCPVLEMAKSAMTLLVHLVDRRFISSPRVVMRPALVLRSSCGRHSGILASTPGRISSSRAPRRRSMLEAIDPRSDDGCNGETTPLWAEPESGSAPVRVSIAHRSRIAARSSDGEGALS